MKWKLQRYTDRNAGTTESVEFDDGIAGPDVGQPGFTFSAVQAEIQTKYVLEDGASLPVYAPNFEYVEPTPVDLTPGSR